MVTVRSLQPLFSRQQLHEVLQDGDRAALLRAVLEFKSVPAGTDMLQEGSRPQNCILLLRGLASRYTLTKAGKRQISAVLVPGDFVDLESPVLPGIDAAICTITSCDVAIFRHADVAAAIDRHPRLGRMFWTLAALEVVQSRKWLFAMGRLQATSQAAHFLCEIYLRMRASGSAGELRMDLPITQLDLADVLGLSAVHVNRVLQALRTAGLVRWQGHRVEILDWDGLAGLADFDDGYLSLAPPARASAAYASRAESLQT